MKRTILLHFLMSTAIIQCGAAHAQSMTTAATSQPGSGEPKSSAAQDQSRVNPPAADPAAGGVGDIVVTANRTQSLASKTPITLTAVTGQKLAQQHITNATALMDVVPNLAIDRGNANGLQINIRGITSTGTTSPSAAFLVDGIYVQQSNAQEVSFFDLDRIEVLRGPQGTLYGRNTTAGVVNLISTAPKPVFGAAADATFGNYGAKQVTAVINVPVTDTLAFRLAGNWDQRESYYWQAVPNPYKLPPDKDNKSVRLSGLWTPTDRVSLLLKLDYSSLRSPGSGFGYSPLISNFYQVPLTVPPEGVREPDPVFTNPSSHDALARRYADAAPFRSRDSTWGATAEFNYKLTDTLTFTTLDGYREFRRNDTGSVFWGTDYSTESSTNTSYPAFTTQLSKSNSEEARLAFDDGRLKVQGGVYHFYNIDHIDLQFNTFNLPNPGSSQESLGVFGQSTYAILPSWRVTGGVRYTDDHVLATGGLILELPFGPLPLSSNLAKGSSSKVTWKVGTDFDIAPNILGYVTVATGYKATGFNGNCNTGDPGCQYKPESLTDFEGGIKARLLDNRLSLNLDYFHYNYRDLQISQIVGAIQNGVEVPSVVTTNAAAAKVDGAELEGAYQLLPNHRLEFSASWLNARYIDYVIEPSNPNSGDYNGDPLDHAPKWAFTVGYTYTQPLENGASIVAGIHTRYSDRYYILNSVLNSQFSQPSFTRTDVSLRYNSAGNRWYVEAFAKNLENGIQVTYINTSPGWPDLNNGTVSTDDPRTFGGRVGIRF